MKNSMNVAFVAICVAFAAGCSKSGEGEDAPAAGVAASQPAAAGTKAKLRISGIPDENPTSLQRKYGPMVDYLSGALGVEIEYVPVTDYGAAVQALIAEKLDFVWLGGFTHVQARNMTEVVPLVMRDIDRRFQSVFIANADAGIERIEEIEGKKMAFGSKSSTSGRLMPSYFLLTQFDIDPARDFEKAPVFSGAHDATVKFVESGTVDAGALNKEVWERMVAEGKVDLSKVEVIWTTPGYVDYVWTARKAVPEELRAKFIDAFLSLDASNPEHKAVLDLQGAGEFVAAQSSDFDRIEEIARKLGLLDE